MDLPQNCRNNFCLFSANSAFSAISALNHNRHQYLKQRPPRRRVHRDYSQLLWGKGAVTHIGNTRVRNHSETRTLPTPETVAISKGLD